MGVLGILLGIAVLVVIGVLHVFAARDWKLDRGDSWGKSYYDEWGLGDNSGSSHQDEE
ncbi:MAG: hypothetical protein LUE16_11040 [Lachnospiraceae bacterium]|nr:hypothetical protein [Lachnospiraceae bacterium]